MEKVRFSKKISPVSSDVHTVTGLLSLRPIILTQGKKHSKMCQKQGRDWLSYNIPHDKGYAKTFISSTDILPSYVLPEIERILAHSNTLGIL